MISGSVNKPPGGFLKSKNMQKPIITYYFDALCGWCYGLTDVMHQIEKKYNDQFDFKVMSGGLFVGDRVGLVNDIAPYIKQGAYKSVEQRTGVNFGAGFLKHGLEENQIMMNSIPPAIALVIVKAHAPTKAFAFAERLLAAVYTDGADLMQAENYQPYLDALDIHIDDFAQKMQEEQYRALALAEYRTTAEAGVKGYPSLVLTVGTQQVLLANGYVDFELLDGRISQVLEQLAA